MDQFARDRLQALLEAGHKREQAAEVLGVDPSTVSREINRRQRRDGRYDARCAQHKARVKRMYAKYQGMKVEGLPRQTKEWIIAQLRGKRSPDEIAGRMKEKKIYPRVGKDAIYRWLYSVWGQSYAKYLCTRRRGRRKQKRRNKREVIPNRKPLKLRPRGKHLVHAEGDTFLSPKRADTQESGVLICEVRSKYIAGRRISNLKPAVMTEAVRSMTGNIRVDTLTWDNGLENRYHEQFGVPSYFCEPHSPWQKPHVENAIGLIRRWFIPKGTDLRQVSEENLQEYISVLNGKWRKSLGYKSAEEVAEKKGVIIKRSWPVNLSSKIAFEVRI